MTPTTLSAYYLIHNGILAFGRAERQGMRIDVEYCERQTEELNDKLIDLMKQFVQSKLGRQWEKTFPGKHNFNSNHQLAHLLYKVRKIKPPKESASGKQGAVDEETLTTLNIPELNMLLRMRKLLKVRDTYLGSFMREQVNGVLHPVSNLHLVRTYRSSSSFHTIPKHDEESMKICRGAILPRKGHQLVEFDYKGIEVSTSVCYHKDPNMMKYVEDPDSDMHRDMGQQIFLLDSLDKRIPAHDKLRSGVKNGFVFPEFYGDYWKSCAHRLACEWGKLPEGRWKLGQGIKMPDGHLSDHLISNGIKSYNHFAEHIKQIEDDFWNRRFKVYQRWKEEWWAKYQKNGYLDMLTGFRCSDLMDRKQACNTPIQGAAFHCLLWAFIEIDKIQEEEGWDSKLIGQIHDSLVMDVHPDELEHVVETVQQVTCEELPKEWPWIIVPLSVDVEACEVDAPWSEKKEYEG